LGLCPRQTRVPRNQIVTERESWILGNKEAKPEPDVEENAKMIDPGFDMMSPAQQAEIKAEVEEALACGIPTATASGRRCC
jgi:isocitrate dehydrogenase